MFIILREIDLKDLISSSIIRITINHKYNKNKGRN